MRVAAVLLLIVPSLAFADAKVAPKAPLPAGPYVVEYNCFHSNAPFGPGSQHSERSFDLAAKVETHAYTSIKDDDHPQAPTKPAKTKLAAAAVTKLAAAVDAVLKGGPYAPEYPVPEGTPCHLAIYGAKHAVAFEIDKAYTKEKDAVSALVSAFPAGSTP